MPNPVVFVLESVAAEDTAKDTAFVGRGSPALVGLILADASMRSLSLSCQWVSYCRCR